jgi:hypothetical protein
LALKILGPGADSLGAGEWAAQRGPSTYGYYWVPGLLAAIIFALVLAASSPKKRPKSGNKVGDRAKADLDLDAPDAEELIVVSAITGLFFWMLLIVLVIIALAGLFY